MTDTDTTNGPEGDQPQEKTAKQLEKEAKKAAKLEKLKAKLDKKTTAPAVEKKDKPEVVIKFIISPLTACLNTLFRMLYLWSER